MLREYPCNQGQYHVLCRYFVLESNIGLSIYTLSVYPHRFLNEFHMENPYKM